MGRKAWDDGMDICLIVESDIIVICPIWNEAASSEPLWFLAIRDLVEGPGSPLRQEFERLGSILGAENFGNPLEPNSNQNFVGN
jgi:hypothetical protein